MIKRPVYVRKHEAIANALNHRVIKANQMLAETSESFSSDARNILMVKNALLINLERSVERLDKFKKLNDFNGELEIIKGVDGLEMFANEPGGQMSAGDKGCLLSHRKAIEYARQKEYPCVLILEDDIMFAEQFNAKLGQAMAELPSHWDCLWLGGLNNKPPLPYSNSLFRLVSTWGAYAYILRNSTYDFWIEKLSEEKQQCDWYYAQYQCRFRSFRTIENLAIHPSRSNSVRSQTNAMAKK